ncbi:divergent polysaccharide deacetylase family protein [Azospirillum sp. RWY-5-1]|uniref:Divergent polysaccharide deacetylase family protein n=2 Tax=Azospirillum oleiclasticum TaxID=2735135 RepID=A0ABX2TDH5_9PROT|nr:divergent polysaccharide deacetylase family protein [Azospirillum oleiclasticum]NYZ13605.1 divergent polysaccharide deacetylase family protein [Azospirillum oleiclasticum]NYZ20765.1 divergent polysaccharide deacetylase family protein [Azospirillum oleiclasticum]
MLGRLKPNLKGLRLPRPRIRLPGLGALRGAKGSTAALAGAWLALAGGLGGLGWWLNSHAADTEAARQSASPQVVVAIANAPAAARSSAPPPATAMAPPPATAAAAAPAPAVAPPAAPPATAPPAAPAPAPASAGLPVPGADGSITLAPAPVPGLFEESKNGRLPRIAEDGRKPWQVYARPFPPNERRPRIAIVMADMGLSGVTTGNAIQRLPPTVTLAFVPQAERLDTWVERARTKGHEVMLALPMEPIDFPRSDPGPNALLTGLPADRNLERLSMGLGKVAGYVGVTSTTGSKFTGSADALKPVMDALKARGLLFVDARVNPRSVAAAAAQQAGVPGAFVDRVIDRDLSRGAIDDQLRELESVAKQQGAAVGLALPYPSTIERINLWAPGLGDRGVVLAPVSAVVTLQKGTGG